MKTAFIAVNETQGSPSVLMRRSNSTWKRVPAAGILRIDPREITLFSSRSAARRAINRTHAYDRASGRSLNEYSIARATAEEKAR